MTPSDFLLAPGRFGSALSPRPSHRRAPRRISPVPLSAVLSSRPLYPGGVLRELFPEAGPQVSGSAVCCLRRDMLGSAFHNPFGRIL